MRYSYSIRLGVTPYVMRMANAILVQPKDPIGGVDSAESALTGHSAPRGHVLRGYGSFLGISGCTFGPALSSHLLSGGLLLGENCWIGCLGLSATGPSPGLFDPVV